MISNESIDRGMLRAAKEDWAGAAELFKKAVSHDAGSVEARFRLGWAYWMRSEAEKPGMADLALGYGAQVFGFEGLARDRGRKFVHHKKLLQESAHWLRETIARQDDHAAAHYYLAHVLKGLGYKDEAAKTAQAAATLQPGNRVYATLVQSMSDDSRPLSDSRGSSSWVKLTWDDLILPTRTKRELRQMQMMLENPDAARDLGIQAPTGILLKGSPGTGKTTIARVLASESKCHFYSITPADINQMFVGVSEQKVRDAFEKARNNAPSILFIDEIDALLPARQGGVAIHSDKVVNQFLQEMDGMTPNNRVFIVGATNRADMLDPAVRRGGRLSREIEIPLPNEEGRLALLKLFLKSVKVAPEVDLTEIVTKTEGASGADLKAIINEAGLQALVRIADEGVVGNKMLTRDDFEWAIENIKSED